MSACIETSWAAVTAIFGSTNGYQEASKNEHEVHDQHPCLEYSVITRNERGSLTQSRCGISARIWRVGVRVIGGYFVGTAVLNMVYTARHARDFLGWLAEHSRFPPYRGVFGPLNRSHRRSCWVQRHFKPLWPITCCAAVECPERFDGQKPECWA